MEDSTPQDRQLAPVRPPIEARNVGDAPDAQSTSTFNQMSRRGYNRVIENYDAIPRSVVPDTSWAAQPLIQNTGQLANYGQPDLSLNNGVSNSGQVQQPITPYYDINNPLGLSADLFSKFFSAAPVEGPQSPVLVGDTGSSSTGGSNAGLFFILIIVGIGGYFLYRRFKQ